MQIRHRLILLLGLPVTCQLLTVGVMIYSYGRIDELAEKELRAKRAIAIGLQIRTTMEKSILLMASQSLTGAGVSVSSASQLSAISRHLEPCQPMNPKHLSCSQNGRFTQNNFEIAGRNWHLPTSLRRETSSIFHSSWEKANSTSLWLRRSIVFAMTQIV